jgi:hypothetical protein
MADQIDDVNAAVLEQLKKKIKEQQTQNVDAAQGAALSRGITGGGFEGVQIARANASASDAMTDASLKFALDAAQRAREDKLTAEERAYQSGEAQKGRDFTAAEGQKGRDFSTSERIGGQTFTAEQNKAAQDFQEKRDKFQNDFAALESEKQRAFAAGESDKVRQFEALQGQMQQQFQAEESELNRIFQGDQNAAARAQEEASSRRAARSDLLTSAVGTLGSVGGNIAGSIFGKSKAGVSTPQTSLQRDPITGAMSYVPVSSGVPGVAPAAGGMFGGASAGSLAAGGALYAAGVAGGAYGGQVAGKSIFGQNTTGVKVGSLLGASGGNPLVGVAGGVVGGVAGKAINAAKKIFCFAPDEMVEMKDGTQVPIADLHLGDHTAGGVVDSIRLSRTEKGTLYNYRGVVVTGYHAVKQYGKWVRVKDADGAIPLNGDGIVCSIATDLHRVYIHGIEFADEVETDFNEFLTIDQSLEVLNGKVI